MNSSRLGWQCLLVVALAIAGRGAVAQGSLPEPDAGAVAIPDSLHQFITENCLGCHDPVIATAGLDLQNLLSAPIDRDPRSWERVLRRIASHQMPPAEEPRPSEESVADAVTRLGKSLDDVASRQFEPGHAESLRRLTRAQYRNAIRDLLRLDVDVSEWLPADESSHGFDHVTAIGLSPTRMSRYLTAAEKISQMAVGRVGRTPSAKTFRIRPDITQDVHIEGLPLGTRGGVLIPYHFPAAGEYEVQVRLMRDRNEELEGLKQPHELEIALDRERVALFTVAPPARGESDKLVDANLTTRMRVTPGTHDVGVAFLNRSSALLESTRQPLNVHFNYYRHPRLGPAVYEVTIVGPFDGAVPFDAAGPGETESRRRIFSCRPEREADEEACAERILSDLLRQAYRRPIAAEDLVVPLRYFHEGRAEGDFEAGIERALSAVLVNPHFLFRVESAPPDVAAGAVYRISDVEFASRLSFFLWNSLPDEELLRLAESQQLFEPEVLEAQVRRMLGDPRSESLVTHFAAQWLHLQNLEAVTPDMRRYPDFDDNLRQAFRQETELFVESILREDRSVLDLIRADYTFLNERLAKHYGIPHVHGSRFRRVTVGPDSHRGGLLRHGSILTVTSYATRTSPVLRGKWVLENLLGTTPPPPPPDIPNLEENTVLASLPVRERLAAHRANPACASCHNLIDPVGFALDQFDAVGRWRDLEEGQPVDASGALPDGSEFSGVAGLEDGLLRRPDLFVSSLTEKLMVYALGRGLEYHDAPTVRRIVAGAREEDYRLSSLILGIVRSVPFQMRRAE
jgi:hypothetical protein